MNFDPAFINIALSTLCLITLAHVLVLVLLKQKKQSPTLKKVLVIIKSWWRIIGFALLCLAFAPMGLTIGYLVISLASVNEFQKHSQLGKIKKQIAILASIAIALQFYSLYTSAWSAFFAIPILFIFLGSSFLIIVSKQMDKLTELFSHYTILILTFHQLAYLPAIYIYNQKNMGASQALYLIFFLILLTELNDILQFICGKAFGKTKPFALISPNKTGAGFIGGIIGITLLASVLLHYFSGFSFVKASLVGLIISTTGIMGDLSFSAIKRYFATKDFSNALPGHGGILDRLDSLIFTAPCVFYFIYFT